MGWQHPLCFVYFNHNFDFFLHDFNIPRVAHTCLGLRDLFHYTGPMETPGRKHFNRSINKS